jgi:Arc/MetJ family transcription regulator
VDHLQEYKESVPVRTNIEIDDALLAEAMTATGLKTKRRAVKAGLRLLARRKRQAAARHLFGRIRWEGDLHNERLDESSVHDPEDTSGAKKSCRHPYPPKRFLTALLSRFFA